MSSSDSSSAAAAANLAKLVNLIRDEEPQVTSQRQTVSAKSVRLASSGTPRRSAYSYVPKSPQLDEIVFAPPTCSERVARYFVIVIYLCGLCCLGFFLSIYHIFFWDSRMPPVFKGSKKSPAFG